MPSITLRLQLHFLLFSVSPQKTHPALGGYTFFAYTTGAFRVCVFTLIKFQMCNVASDPDVARLVRFETFCREAFIHNQHLVSVWRKLMTLHGSMGPPWLWPKRTPS